VTIVNKQNVVKVTLKISFFNGMPHVQTCCLRYNVWT